ncbi:MAG: glutamine-hydrolyzing GMP synthase [Acidobacteriota bacterium]|nr:MAG: glutamine-hydrolyzing GMP synthase [Acidobacteriota bacterium]
MHHDAIAVIDFGGQYAHLIATKVRRHHVLAEIRQPEDPTEEFKGYKGIIVSGSPALASKGEDSAYNKGIYDLDIPILGLCFGHQEIAQHYGGKVVHGGREWGHADMHLTGDHPMFEGLGPVEQVWMSHFDSVAEIGPEFKELGYTVLGSGKQHRYAAIGSDTLKRYGFQFHAEVDDTPNGDRMIANFVLGVCGCTPSWSMDRYIDEQVQRIREQVGGNSVFLLASGGVDSTVAAKLFANALGPDRLRLLHIDNGLMRKEESRKVVEMFKLLDLEKSLHFVDASEDFLEALHGVVEPEQKRTLIGNTFIEVFEREARRLGIEDHLLGQGTIYPDTIETGGTKRADTIKTHHNRVPIIAEMMARGRVVEPLVELYKVEVRELGEKLGIPSKLIWRHPFPGPGLGVRLLCSEGLEDTAALKELSADVESAASSFGLSTTVLPIKSVGVKADVRSYEHPVLITGKAEWGEILEASGTILKEVAGINRCLLNLVSETPQALKPLAATTTRERLDLLREADAIVMEGLRRYGLYDSIWQCPTVLVPLEIDGKGRELCIIRPVHSERAMTASAARLPEELLQELKSQILALPGISGVAFDLTSKPPGTIEWE